MYFLLDYIDLALPDLVDNENRTEKILKQCIIKIKTKC